MDVATLKLYAELQVLSTRLERLKMDNVEAEIHALPPKWSSKHFISLEIELEILLKEINNLSKAG